MMLALYITVLVAWLLMMWGTYSLLPGGRVTTSPHKDD